MADKAHHASERGSMNISEQVKTWHWFVQAVKWTAVATVIFAAFLAIFRTN